MGFRDKMTKNDSRLLYGTAILMMLYHHLFKVRGSLDCEILTIPSLFGVTYYYPQTIAWFGKICVAIYAFVSGYGLSTKAACSVRRNLLCSKIKISLKQIRKLYIKYWTVFVLFVGLFSFLGWMKIELGPKSVLNLLAIRFDYNGAWWYVRNYVLMLVFFPFLDSILSFVCRWKKAGLLTTIPILYVFAYYLISNQFLIDLLGSVSGVYLAIFTEGILVEKLKLFEKLDLLLKYKVWNKLIILVVVIAIRIIAVKNAGDCVIDLIVIFPFIYCIIKIINHWLLAKKILQFIGDYSTYMWLVHGFFFEMPVLRCYLTWCRFSIVIWIQLILVSLAVAFILTKAESAIFAHSAHLIAHRHR